MVSNSRIYTFINDKVVNPTKLEIELSNILNFWNNHEQGLQTHSIVWTSQLWLMPTVVTAAGTYAALPTDSVIIINKTAGAATTVNLSSTLNTGRVVIIKDGKGDAGTNNITVQGNGKNIDGSASATISSNFGAARYIYNGTQWNAI